MGAKTRTVKLDGNLYQERRVPCGKHDHCKTCQQYGGHLAVYMDTGRPGGQRWQHVGDRLPESDPDYQTPTCQRDGCHNETPRRSQKYCSAKCRVAAHRAK